MAGQHEEIGDFARHSWGDFSGPRRKLELPETDFEK
jgi:hypothetical protein